MARKKRGPYRSETRGSVKECTTELGQFLRNRRLELNLTEDQLAAGDQDGTSCTQQTICNVERGNVRVPRNTTLLYLAKQLGCDVETLRALCPKAPKPAPECPTPFGQFVQERQQALDLSNVDLCRRLTCGPGAISLMRMGKSELPTITAKALAAALECTVEEIECVRKVVKKKLLIVREDPLGKLISDRRTELGFTQKQVGYALGVTREYVRLMEMGEVGVQKLARLQKLAEFLRLDPEDLRKHEGQRAVEVRNRVRMRLIAHAQNPLVKFLIEERARQGLTQRMLAEKMSYTKHGVVSALEREALPMTRKHALSIASALGVALSEEQLSHVSDAGPAVIKSPPRTVTLVSLLGYLSTGWKLQLVNEDGRVIPVKIE